MKEATGKSPRKRTPSAPPQTSASARKKLTLKQRQFLANKLKGQSSAKAAKNAGYAASMCRHAERIVSPALQEKFREMLRASGLSDELLSLRIEEGLNATAISKATAHAEREILVNFSERREMVELVLRLRGMLTQKHEHEIQAGDGTTMTIEVVYVGTDCDMCGASEGATYSDGSKEKLCDDCRRQASPRLTGMVGET